MSVERKRITGLWQHVTASGEVVLSGKIGLFLTLDIGPEDRLEIWPNNRKTGKGPDYIAYLVTGSSQQQQPGEEEPSEQEPELPAEDREVLEQLRQAADQLTFIARSADKYEQ